MTDLSISPDPGTLVVSAVDVADYLGYTLTAANTPKLEVVIAQAQSAIEKRVGFLTVRTITSRVRGGVRALVLPHTPAIALTSVKPTGGTALDISGYFLDPDAGVVQTLPLLPRTPLWLTFPYASYDVTYTAGRDPAVIDADLMQAVIELVRHLWIPRRGAPVRQPAAAEAPMQPRDGTPPYALPHRVLELIEPHTPGAVFG